MKSQYVQLSCLLFATAVLAASALAIGDVPLLAAYFSTPSKTVPVAEYAGSLSRNLFAINQSSKNRGSISVYDIDAGHRLIKTIPNAGLLHGIDWTPDQSEVWESSTGNEPHIYIWDYTPDVADVGDLRMPA
jgi:hypothetical protein